MTVSSADRIDWQVIPWKNELPSAAREIWDALGRQDRRAPVFNRREWLDLARQAGAITPWGIVVIRCGRQVVGLFPLCKRSPWTWEVLAYLTQDSVQMLIDPLHEEAAWAGLAQWVADTASIGMLTLKRCGDANHLAQLQAACRARGLSSIIEPLPIPSVHCDLPGTWDDFLSVLDPSHRRALLRAERRLYKEYHDVCVDILTEPAACLEALDEMIRLYRTRWGGSVGGCVFDNPRNVAFYREAMRWAAESGYAAVSTLRVRGRLIVASTKFHIPGQDMLCEHYVARDLQALPNRYSPGLVECCHTIRWAMARGVKTLNLGMGMHEYKLMLNGSARSLWNIRIIRNGLARKFAPAADRVLHVVRRLPVHLGHHLKRPFRTAANRISPDDS